MENLKKLNWGQMSSTIIYIILGLVLAFFPQTVNEMISYVLAAALFLVALIFLFNYFKKNVQNNFFRNDLVFAVIALVIGILLLVKRSTVLELIPVILGAVTIISGVKKLQNALDLIRLKLGGWKSIIILAAINIVFGIILVWQASAAVNTVIRLIGIGLVFSGASDLFSMLWIKRIAKKFSTSKDNDLVEIDETK
ncbi:MAG: DUF308 domain-containing protein [Clostridia bacterium]|nr:DUF308 domain-containing protein [Clostridia bacterium]